MSLGFILKPNDPNLRRAIGRDDHLDQSHAQDLGQRLKVNLTRVLFGQRALVSNRYQLDNPTLERKGRDALV